MARSPGWLLQELEDQFVAFPIQSVGRSIAKNLADADDSLLSALTNVPAARKYWPVEAEHYFDEIGLLVGAAFVLGQVLIGQTASIVDQLRLANALPADFPRRKVEWLRFCSPQKTGCRLSEIEIITTAANYFKHHCEWPVDWYRDGCELPGNAKTTVENARAIGMSGESRTDNLMLALDALEISTSSVDLIARKIVNWRTALHDRIRGVDD